MIRIDAVWLAVTPMDMRAGTDTALARVVAVFGAAHPHTAYIFANKRGNRLKVLVHDGIGIWLAARRLHQGKFVWPSPGGTVQQHISRDQLNALVIGLPWARIGEAGVITRRVNRGIAGCRLQLGDVPIVRASMAWHTVSHGRCH